MAELLPRVCEAVCAVATVRSVEVLLWDAERSCLQRAAADGRELDAGDSLPGGDAADRLETGEVVTLSDDEFAVPPGTSSFNNCSRVAVCVPVATRHGTSRAICPPFAAFTT